jgi:prephenate dehydrogenase
VPSTTAERLRSVAKELERAAALIENEDEEELLYDNKATID